MPTMHIGHTPGVSETCAYIGAGLGLSCDSVSGLALHLSSRLNIRSTHERLLALGIVSEVVQQAMAANGLSIDGAVLTLNTIFVGHDGELAINRELYHDREFRLGRNK
jgi:hypothetical protein